MQKKLVWLSTSLFSKRSHWQCLIKNGIMPFLESGPCKQYLVSYSAELNYLSGENIRFSLLTEEGFANNLVVHVDAYFKDFFSALPGNKESQPGPNGVFVAFPTNSIQYGLYAPTHINEDETANFAFGVQLSATMLEALSNDSNDDEVLLCLAFYLSICLLEVLTKSYPGIYMQLLELKPQNSYVTGTTLDEEYLNLKFQENKDILLGIAEQIINMQLEELPSWALTWMRFCDNKLREGKALAGNDEYAISFHRTVSFYIYKQLGLSVEMGQILRCFVKNTFKGIIEKTPMI